ncbi:hypothetical protein [Streptomyces sp. NPDC046985]
MKLGKALASGFAEERKRERPQAVERQAERSEEVPEPRAAAAPEEVPAAR